MPTWLTYLTAALKLLGLVDWAQSLVERYMARKQGQVEQNAISQDQVLDNARKANLARAEQSSRHGDGGGGSGLLSDDGFRRD